MGDLIAKIPDHVKELAAECIKEHVDVVQAIISGNYSSNTEAYMSVYTDSDYESAKANVSRMLTIDNVQKLYEVLRDLRLEEGILSRSKAMKILSDMAVTTMGDLVNFGSYELTTKDGEKIEQSVWSFKNSDQMAESHLRSICELTANKDGSMKIKQHDQKAAIKQLADMAGWDAPKKVEHSGELKAVNKEMSLEEATQIYQDNLKLLDSN